MEQTLKLTSSEAGQIIDALESRQDAYQKTAEFYQGTNDGCDFMIEEVSGEHEAENLAEMYASLIEKIRGQFT